MPTPVSHRDVHFVAYDIEVNTPVYDAGALIHQHTILGPAIVTTENTTYLVEPGWRLEPTPRVPCGSCATRPKRLKGRAK